MTFKPGDIVVVDHLHWNEAELESAKKLNEWKESADSDVTCVRYSVPVKGKIRRMLVRSIEGERLSVFYITTRQREQYVRLGALLTDKESFLDPRPHRYPESMVRKKSGEINRLQLDIIIKQAHAKALGLLP